MPSGDREHKKQREEDVRESAEAERPEEVWSPPPDLEPLPSMVDEAAGGGPAAAEPELIDLPMPAADEEFEEEAVEEAGEGGEDEEIPARGAEEEEEAPQEPDEQEGEDGEAAPGDEKTRRRGERKTPRLKNPAEAKAILECLLFAAVEPMSLREICEYIYPIKPGDLRALIVELQNEYDSRGGGLQIVEIAGGYQMATRPGYADWVLPLFRRKRRSGLSPAMLETLAIISYKQPIIRAELDAIRGVDSSGVVRGLQDIGLIDIIGQKQVPGRPNMYGTTRAFLKYFGLKSLSDLPSIESLRKQFELSKG